MNRLHVTCGHVATAPAAGAGVGAAAVAAVRHLPGLDSTVSLRDGVEIPLFGLA
jgi:hypothetical protein